jgi:hypothetical protein
MSPNQTSHSGVGGQTRPPAFLFKEKRTTSKVWESRMDFDSLGDIIATRMLHLVDERGHKRPVSVFIGKPEPAEDASGYKCPYQVIGIGSQETQLARGTDSIQALQSAIALAGASLRHLNEEVGGGLFWNGGPEGDLGFS